MKRFIVLLLMVGIIMAGTQFPENVQGSVMELTDYSGDLSNGEAYYESYDQTIIGYVAATPMSQSEFNGNDYSSWTYTSEPGTTCYYVCGSGSDSYGVYSYCNMDCYYDGTYFWIDTAMDGGSEYDALYEDLVLAKEIIGEVKGTGGGVVPPDGNGDGDDNGDDDNGDDDNDDKGEGFDISKICPLVSFALLGIAASFARKG